MENRLMDVHRYSHRCRVRGLVLACGMVSAGCGALTQSSAFTAHTTEVALLSADEALSKAEQTKPIVTARREIFYARERMSIYKMQFGEVPKRLAKIKRASAEDRVQTDIHRALARQVQRNREIMDALRNPFLEAWSWFKWLVRWGPWIVLTVGAALSGIWVYRQFRVRDRIQVQFMEKALPNGGERAKIAAGTPVGKAADRMKRRGEL